MKQRALTVAAAVIAAAAAVTWVAQGTGPSESSISAGRSPIDRLTPSPVAPAPAPSASLRSLRADLVSYAIPTTELQGLPPNLASGTRLDLWVAWQPPITKETELQPLLRGVLLDKIVPPVLPEGPHSAILMVDRDEVPDLIWGDRFGALNAVVPPDGQS